MRLSFSLLFAALGISVLIGEVHVVLPGDTSPLCSIIPTFDTRYPTVTAILGRALPETVLAGPGAVQPVVDAPGHWGRARNAPIYAQLVEVEALEDADHQRIIAWMQQRNDPRVAVVPWDYAPDCRPVAWGRSARWVSDTSPGFYRVRLRDSTDWAEGRPTFDAFHADLSPYPHGAFYQRGFRGTGAVRDGEGLTGSELFDFYRQLPTPEERAARSSLAESRLNQWLAANPALRHRYPVPLALRQLSHTIPDAVAPPANDSLEPTGRPAALPRRELRPGRPAAQFKR